MSLSFGRSITRRVFKKKKQKKIRKVKESNLFKYTRNDIVENDIVHCPAFTAPLLDFGGEHNDSDQEDYSKSEFADFPTIISAKKKWKKLFEIIMDKKGAIPLKQMAIKKKHEDLIFEKM